MSTESKRPNITATNPDNGASKKKPGSGRVKALETKGFENMTVEGFLESPKGLAGILKVVRSANRPVSGPLADGYFDASHTGLVDITTMMGTPLYRSVKGPADWVMNHVEMILGYLEPMPGGTKVSSIVKRASEKDVLAALETLASGGEAPDIEATEEEEEGSELDENDKDAD